MVILFGSIIYFFSKETIRSSGGNFSKFSFLILGLVIGSFIFYITFIVNFKITSDSENILNILNPFMVYLILFSTMIDRRYFIPLMIFSLLGFTFNNNLYFVSTSTPEETFLFFSNIINILILSILLFLPSENNIFKKNSRGAIFWSITMFIIYISISFISISIIISLYPKEYLGIMKIWTINFLYIMLIFWIQIFIISFIEKMYRNFNKLETYSIKDDVSYYKMSLAQKKLKNIISTEKYKIGFLLLFDIKSSERNKTHNILNEIKEKTNEKYNDVFYFKATTNYYGAFIPMKNDIDLDIIFNNNKKDHRTEEDKLYEFDKIISNTKKKYETNINISGSIYGVHSYDIKEIIEFAKFLFSPFVAMKNKSTIIIYDFKRIKERLKERVHVSSLAISTNNTDISFLRAISKDNIFYPNIYFGNNKDDSKISITNLFNKKDITPEDKEMIIRNSAYQSLRNFDKKNSSLVIYYPNSYLENEDFALNSFINKVERHMPTNKLILGLFGEEEISEKLLKNINLLREKGIRVALLNPSNVKQKFHDDLNPDFLLQLDDNKSLLKLNKEILKINSNVPSLNINLV